MTTGRPRDLRKEAHWRQLLLRWRHSGLSVSAFCRHHRLAVHSFYAWRRTLAQRDAQAPAPRPTPPVTFVPVPIQHAQAAAPRRVELLFPDGRRLRFPASVDPARLRALLAVLEEPSCSA
jgi:transposase-like protein